MIEGLRTRCRPVEREDQAFIHELNADPEVRRNVVGWAMPASLHAQESWFEREEPSTTHRFIVEDLSGERIGLTGLWGIDWHSRNALTALKIGGTTPQRGKGYGTDAIMTMMAFAFDDVGLERLYSEIIESNTASRRAYVERCGWTVEGVARSHVWREGALVDVLHVGILREDFYQHPQAAEYVSRLRRSTV